MKYSTLHRIQESRGNRSDDSANAIAAWIVDKFSPKHVVDIGCGDGAMLNRLKRFGCSVLGFDERLGAKQLDAGDFGRVNLALCFPMIQRRPDLILCMEVMEHVEECHADRIVSGLCRASNVILFAAGIPLQGGYWHVNEQWQSYWAKKFAGHGMFPHSDFREFAWNSDCIRPWYKQDTIIYATPEAAERFQLNRMDTALIDVVHPETWERIGPMGIKQRVEKMAGVDFVSLTLLMLSAAFVFCVFKALNAFIGGEP